MKTSGFYLLVLSIGMAARPLSAQNLQQLSTGQTVYVSVYSNILAGPKGVTFHLDATLVVRNTDMTDSVTITAADFHDTDGTFVRAFIEQPLTLGPLGSRYIHVPEKAIQGGVGANFIVKWRSGRKINAPIVECIMIGVRSGQGISFISSGKVIQEH